MIKKNNQIKRNYIICLINFNEVYLNQMNQQTKMIKIKKMIKLKVAMLKKE